MPVAASAKTPKAQDSCPSPANHPHLAVESPAAAVAIAKPEFVRKYGDENISQHEPYNAKLEGEAWHVYGHMPEGALGGIPEAFICRADGKILTVFHTQ
jgi:hypothetical protein